MLILRKITEADEQAVNKAVESFKVTPEFIFTFGFEPGMSFKQYLARLEDYENGQNLPDAHVSSTMLFAFEGPDCVGRLMIRHRLNEFLSKVGGHIGYGVVPEFRNRGYAKAMLRMSLPVAKLLDIDRALVTCDEGNVGSIKTIEANGGVLENTVKIGEGKPLKRRYWIDLA